MIRTTADRSYLAKTLRYEGVRREGDTLLIRASLGGTILEAPATIDQVASVIGFVQERRLDELDAKVRKCFPSLF